MPDQDASEPRSEFTFQKSFTFGRRPPDGEEGETIPGPMPRFRWEWRRPETAPPEVDTLDREPATYYEALSGRPDPMRDFFVNGRRILNWIVTTIAIGLPIGLISLGLLTGQSFETIFFMGFGGAVVGLMFRSSFPRTPFG
jgi:hypothetical protein